MRHGGGSRWGWRKCCGGGVRTEAGLTRRRGGRWMRGGKEETGEAPTSHRTPNLRAAQPSQRSPFAPPDPAPPNLRTAQPSRRPTLRHPTFAPPNLRAARPCATQPSHRPTFAPPDPAPPNLRTAQPSRRPTLRHPTFAPPNLRAARPCATPTFAPPTLRAARPCATHPSQRPPFTPPNRHATPLIPRDRRLARPPGHPPDHHANQAPRHPNTTPPSPTPWTLTHAPAILGHGGWAGAVLTCLREG